MCTVSNILCGEWKLKHALQDTETPAQLLAFFSVDIRCHFVHKGKSNTSFGTVKGLLLFVCTHNINKTLCFYKIKNKSSCLEQERFTKIKLGKYMPHRHDK